MNGDYPRNEEIISEAEWDKLKAEAKQYYDLALEKTNQDVSGSCQHILNNAAAGLDYILDEEVPKEKRLYVQERTNKCNDLINRYLKLLEDYPQFAEKEEQRGDGTFPDIFHSMGKIEELITAYEARLRK